MSNTQTTEGQGAQGGQQTQTDPAAWLSGVDQGIRDHLVSKNLTDPKMVAQSYVHLEKLMSGGPESFLKLPTKPSDTPEGKEAWSKIYDKLGRPSKWEEYGLHGEQGKENPQGAEFAKAFHELGLSKKQVEAITNKWNTTADAIRQKEEEQFKQTQDNAVKELKSKWGNAYDQNLNVAKKIINEFPEFMNDETWAGLEKTLGTAKTIELFHALMSKTLQNSKFEDGGDNKGFGKSVLTPEQAKLELSHLSKSADFAKRLADGDIDAIDRFNKLNKWAVGYED